MMNLRKKLQYQLGNVVYANNINIDFDYTKPESDDNPRLVKNFFLIIYSEEHDVNTMHMKNYTALKLTTQLIDEQIYCVKLEKKKNKFMMKDGYVSCSKVHTLGNRQIIGSLGVLDSETFKKVFKVYHKYNNEIERQMLEKI